MTGFGYGLLFGCSPVIGTIPFPSYVLIDSYSIRAFRDGVRTPGHALNLTPAISGTAFNFSFGKLLLRKLFLIAQAVYSMHMRKACLTDVTKVKLAMPPRFC